MHNVYNPTLSRAEKQAHWKKLVSAWYKSDLTAKEFCEAEQIKGADLKRWAYRLRKQQKNLTCSVYRSQASFIPLQLIPEISKQNEYVESPIELVINHYCVRINSSFNEEALLRLIQVLMRAS